MEHSDSDSDSSDPEPESDLDEVAATLAIGKKFFLTKKRKREFEDDGYNRYAFDDRDELPTWYASRFLILRSRIICAYLNRLLTGSSKMRRGTTNRRCPSLRRRSRK